MSVKRRKKLTVIVILLVLIEIFSVIFVWNITSDKETVLDNVKLRDNEKSLKGLAIMLETEHNSDDYEESNTSSWPKTGYKFNKEKSGCIDNSGSTIENSLSYDSTTNIVTVDTGVTTKCYIYFDKRYSLEELCTSGEDTLGECLTNNNSTIESLNDNVEGGLYRYQGTQELVDDNYICFGTTSKEECTSNTDAYMYRIIGIDENNQLKLIKMTSIGEMQWWTDYTTDITWPNSLIYKNINGEKYLENSKYMPSGWSKKIVDYDWKYGDFQPETKNATELYDIENNWTTTTLAKIGLMKVSDYSYGIDANNICDYEHDYLMCRTSWVYCMYNNGKIATELTMTRFINSNNKYVNGIHREGYFTKPGLNSAQDIRPVFYLTSNETFASGNGTIDDPIIIGKTKGLCENGDNLGNCLIENNSKIESLDDTAYSGMYRYTGTDEVVNNNYICFGTSNKTECLNNPNKYMYRMIGVTSAANSTLGLAANQVKVTKAASIGTHNWHSSYSSDTKWESSTMYTHLQNNVLSNTSYIPSGWSNKISSVKWNIGDVQTYTNGDTVYGLEYNTQTTNTSKVGLMYLSDYYYAYNAGGTTNCNSTACTNWLTDTSNTTLTMSRYGKSGSHYHAWDVGTSGFVGTVHLGYELAVRPVFYLNSDEVFVSGMGTKDDPIMLGEPELTPIGEYIQNAKPAGYNTTAEGGLNRFQGTTADNYICFGTTSKEECTSNTDAYMYRIIGINSSGQLKLIKKEALNTAYYWHNDRTPDTTWTDSDLFKGLNGISGGKYSNLFIGNSTYMPSGWSDKIADTNWKIGDNTNVRQTAQALYNAEDAWTAGQTAYKIGLMYAHDYAYGISGGNNCSSSGAHTTCKTSWLHLSNNDSGAPLAHEWTMSRYGYSTGHYYAWVVYSGGYFGDNNLGYTAAVRPVFYLKSSVNFIGGTGTASDPFLISY